jgi:hypothetical protein
MALFIRQDENQSRLQSKVAADLQDRLNSRANVTADKPEATILDEQHKTRSAGIIIAVLVVIAAGVIFWLVSRG